MLEIGGRTASVLISNRQKTRFVNVRLLRWICRALLTEILERQQFDLAVYLVGAARITALNEQHLQHAGSTDVIAFDYGDSARPGLLFGEIFICVDEACAQARRFRTTWQREVVRYLVHGVLHLCGYDDSNGKARLRMKQAEDRLLRRLSLEFHLAKLGGHRLPRR